MSYANLRGLWDDGIGIYFPRAGAAGLGGLGEEGCDQPVSTEDRDKLRGELSRYVDDYYGQTPKLGPGGHWHEGHPDIRAYLADIVPLMRGLRDRPRLLRCSAEARRRANVWLDDIRNLLDKIKQGRRGGMTVIPDGGVNVPLHGKQGRVYHIRGPWYDGKFQPVGGGKEIPKPPAKFIPLPNGGNGGGNGEKPTKGKALPPHVWLPNGEGEEGGLLPPEVQGLWEALTAGEIFGIPKVYVAYGAIALVAWNILKKK